MFLRANSGQHNKNTEHMTKGLAFDASYVMDELCHAYDSDAMDLAANIEFSQQILSDSMEVEES